MPNIPSIKIGDTTYDVKDQVARDHLVEVGTAEPTPQSMHPDNRLYVKDYGSAQDEEAHTYVVPTMDEFNDTYSRIEWLAKKTGTDRAFSIRTVGSSISKDATLTKLKANAGSKIKFNVSGSGFASQDVYVYFKYVGSDSYTNMQTIRVGQDTTKTAEYELEEFYLYHGSANAGETITITAVVTDSLSGDIISDIIALNTEVDNRNAFDNTILNQLNYQTGCEISIKTVIAKSTISAGDTAIAMTFVKGDAFDAYVDGDGVSGLTGITVYLKYYGESTRTNIGSINAGTRKRFYVPNNAIEVSFYKTGNASANIGKSIGIVISRVNQIKQIVPYFQQSPKNFIASDFIRGVTNATSGVIPSNTSDGGVIMPFSVTGGLTYTMWWENDMQTQNMVYLYILELDSSKEPIKRSDGIARTTLTKTITLDEDTRYVSISVFSSGVNWEDTLPSRIQFELGSNKTEFENHEVIKPEFLNAKQIYDKLYNAGYMSTDGAATLPDYYNAYMVTKAARINDLAKVCAGQGDAFIFITDEHWTMNQQQSPKLISYLNASCCIARVFSGGDTGNDVDPDFCKKIRSSFNHEIHHVMGNHEWFEPNGNIAFYYMDSYEKEQIGNTVEHYYYVDNPQKKIRYIILNAYLSNNGSPINGYTQDQLSWLTNVALDIETGWSVIVFTHDFDPSESNVSPFASALDTAKSNGKDVIAVFIGHRHYDAVWHTTGGIPIIVTTCDKNEPWINSGTDMEPWLTSQRIAGTTSEQAFDTVVIDRENKTIKCVRIGGLAMDNVDKKQGQTGFTTDGTLEERTITYI